MGALSFPHHPAASTPLLALSAAHRQSNPAEFGFSSAEFSCTVLICIEFVGRLCTISKKRFGIGSADELVGGKSVRILPLTRSVSCTVNPQVPGSSPGRGAKRILHLRHPSGWLFAFLGIEIEKVRRSLLEFCIWPTLQCLRGHFGADRPA